MKKIHGLVLACLLLASDKMMSSCDPNQPTHLLAAGAGVVTTNVLSCVVNHCISGGNEKKMALGRAVGGLCLGLVAHHCKDPQSENPHVQAFVLGATVAGVLGFVSGIYFASAENNADKIVQQRVRQQGRYRNGSGDGTRNLRAALKTATGKKI